MLRIVSLAFIFAHFRLSGLALVIALLLSNLALALLILPKNGRVKTLWTFIAAVVAPACFVSADTIEIYELSSAAQPEDRFQKFYICNVWNFFIWCLVAAISLNCLSAYEVIPFQEVNLVIATFGHPIQLPIMGWGSIFWVVLAMLLSIGETIVEMRFMS